MIKETFERIGNIIKDNPSIANYTITGYKYLKTRLVLHFRDCNQVYDFEEVDGELKVTMFFTKDFSHDEYMDGLSTFGKLHKKDVPEEEA
jgi:hypothetical protein